MKGFMASILQLLGHAQPRTNISPHVRDSRAESSAGSDILDSPQHDKCQSAAAAQIFDNTILQSNISVLPQQRKRAASARSIFSKHFGKQKSQLLSQTSSSTASQSYLSRFPSVHLRTSTVLTFGNTPPSSEAATSGYATTLTSDTLTSSNLDDTSTAPAAVSPDIAVVISLPQVSPTRVLQTATPNDYSVSDASSVSCLRQRELMEQQQAPSNPRDSRAHTYVPAAPPTISSPGTAPSPASPRPPAPPTTLLAVSPGTPDAMRRPMWRLADYNIGARLYKGEVSSVYKAVCIASGLPVALKVYSLSRVADNALHTLVREIRIHTELAHPHVLMLYGVFEEANRLVLVLARAVRGDLLQVHRSLPHCRMSEDQLRVLVLAPLLDALTYLHARGVCHRDIKPENLLMTSSWQLRVADFGAAINLAAERAVTRTGTMDYMAPEVERCPLKAAPDDNKDNMDLAYSTSADVWSLGVLAYEMLVGFPPFVDLMGVEGPSRQSGPRELSFPAFVSAGAQDFISSALAERPGDRPTAAQLMRHPWVKHAMRQHVIRQQAPSALHDVPTMSETQPQSAGSQKPLQRQLQQVFGAQQRSVAIAAPVPPPSRGFREQHPECPLAWSREELFGRSHPEDALLRQVTTGVGSRACISQPHGY